MAVQADFSIGQREDVVLNISMTPPTAIGGWSLQFFVQHRFGGISGLISKVSASGYGAGQSGITIGNSGQGQFSVSLQGVDTSGMEYGSYAYTAMRLNSGSQTVLSLGYLLLNPGIQG